MLGRAKVVLFKAALPAGVSTSVVHVALTRLLHEAVKKVPLALVAPLLIFGLLPARVVAAAANSRFTDN